MVPYFKLASNYARLFKATHNCRVFFFVNPNHALLPETASKEANDLDRIFVKPPIAESLGPKGHDAFETVPAPSRAHF
jgi:hypothetical protein